MAKTTFKSDTINYHLDVKIGIDRLPLSYQHIEEFYIVQDLNKFLPSFRLRIRDTEGFLSHLVPFDKKANTITVVLGSGPVAEGTVEYKFKVYRRFPTSDDIYDVEGLLDVEGLFSPPRTRGLSGTIRDNLSSIAIDELGLDDANISASLDYNKNIVQPSWSNAELFRYLESNLQGLQEDAGYFCYVCCKKRKKILVFKSVKDFYSQFVKYNFINTFDPQQDEDSGEVRYPIFEYKVFDNYKVVGDLRKQNYSYFDYDNSEYKVDSISVKDNTISQDDYYSLTKYFLIDKDDSEDSGVGIAAGRGNDFSSNFKGRIKGNYYKRLNSLSKLWITSLGLEDIYPGDIARVQFLNDPSMMMSYQYHGFWMVERVIHMIGHQFATRLLLTRSGMNTMEDTSLLEANSGNIKLK